MLFVYFIFLVTEIKIVSGLQILYHNMIHLHRRISVTVILSENILLYTSETTTLSTSFNGPYKKTRVFTL